MTVHIPFNRPFMTGNEFTHIEAAHRAGHLAGDGAFSRQCHEWLARETGAAKALLTHSCTGALEMAAILAGLEPGDEVIMPSYTFVSTANAFILRGAVPVFVDIRADTLNIDERQIDAAVTDRTRAIVPVHYAGVACEMDQILEIAEKNDLFVIEDAAQGIQSRYRDRALGTLGDLGTLSFHETKNVISGEGGALLLRDDEHAHRAEIIREKGTNRKAFFRGEVDKYTWVDLGSSYLPSELIAAFLWAQLEAAESITSRRKALWRRYHEAFAELESEGLCRRPVVPEWCSHNAHLYYLLLPNPQERDALITFLRERQIQAVFHYVPLHSSPFGSRICRTVGALPTTTDLAARLVRLPLWIGLEEHQDRVIDAVRSFLLR